MPGRYASLWDDEIKNDMDAIGRNPLNAKADKVVECSKVSFYKGVPVYRANLPSSFSFAAILLDTSDVNETTVKHGYGGSSILWDAGMTPDTIPWTLGGVPYYDSDIIYYAVGS